MLRLHLAPGPDDAAAAAAPPPPASGNGEVREEAVVALETLNERATLSPCPFFARVLLVMQKKKKKNELLLPLSLHFFLSLAFSASGLCAFDFLRAAACWLLQLLFP